MEVNTLVRHNKLRSLGIGCVSKVLKSTVIVNFGESDVIKMKPADLTPVDTSRCKTIPFNDWRRQTATNHVKHNIVIVGNEVKQYVGIGWITERIVTDNDLKTLRRVI